MATTRKTAIEAQTERQAKLMKDLERQLQLLVDTATSGVGAAVFGTLQESIQNDGLLRRIFAMFDGLIHRKVTPSKAAETIASVFAGAGADSMR